MSSLSLSPLWSPDRREERGELDTTSTVALHLGVCRGRERRPDLQREREREATPPGMGEAALPPAVSGVGGEASVAFGPLLALGRKGGGEGMRVEEGRHYFFFKITCYCPRVMSCRQDYSQMRLWIGMIH